MEIDKINSIFIETIKRRVTGSPMDVLQKILPLSKEAIYRRLRGDVLFSFSEATLIAQYLQISLDEIALDITHNTNNPTFATSEESYKQIIEEWIDQVSRFGNKESSHFYVMTSGLPVSLLTSYNSLLKFNYYISIYQKGNIDKTLGKFSEMLLSPSLLESLAILTACLQNVHSTYIISDNPFAYYSRQIQYLYDLELIGPNDIRLIKEDLFRLVDDFKSIASYGKYRTGHTVNFYVSEVNIDTSFGIFEDSLSNIAFIKMFGMNYVLSQNTGIISVYKKAFDNMKHFATLISHSGSTKRKQFFKDQESFINKII